MADRSQTPEWQALQRHREALDGQHLTELFAADGGRFAALSRRIDGALFDFSKQRLTGETISLLCALARAADLEDWRERLFAGEPVNGSEHRAALHVALRAEADARFRVAGEPVMPRVLAERERMRALVTAIRDGRHTGFAGTPIRHIVNLGIGGSDLGPRMACAALAAQSHPALSVDFVANVDGADLAGVLEGRDPRATLFIVASKTFTTIETLTNANSARLWLLEAAGGQRDLALSRHVVGVTANPLAARDFGIVDEHIFPFADWVGGRFSLWSPIGLPLALSIGFDGFESLLAGARHLDAHFRETPLEDNVPVLMALIGIWNRNFLGSGWQSVVPYSQALRLLPGYLQQLEMESNGKSVDRDGAPLGYPTVPAIFGDAGTNAQHAYFQWLHQGPRDVPTDFIVFARSEAALPGHHEQLLANCLAQSAALAFGDAAKGDARRACPGNQPSTTMLMPRLDPYHLGMLLAAYEHKTFTQGVVWGINPFDQWGVELGKRLARRLLPMVGDRDVEAETDASTRGLLGHLHALRAPGG
jgi:glucose-6-phosphate isomerase